MFAGRSGPALQIAMQVIAAMGEIAGAERLIPISSAHIDSCLYHGSVGLDFAERLAGGGGRVAVPTTLNVSSLDLLHPEIVRLPKAERDRARRQMDAYVAMGCQPTWTCAPYQLPERPGLRLSTLPGRSRTRSSSPIRCSARGRVATATSSTSAPR